MHTVRHQIAAKGSSEILTLMPSGGTFLVANGKFKVTPGSNTVAKFALAVKAEEQVRLRFK